MLIANAFLTFVELSFTPNHDYTCDVCKTIIIFCFFLIPPRQEPANLPVEPFFIIFRRFLKNEEKNEDSLNS